MIGFIGGGNISSSLVGGLVQKGYPAQSIYVADPHPEKRQRLKEKWHIQVTPDLLTFPQLDIIVLAVKPKSMHAVVTALVPLIRASTLLISVATGISTQLMQQWLAQPDFPIIRAMPNTPALYGYGMTGLFKTASVSAIQVDQGTQLFQAVGEIVWLEKETLIDPLTALSGSGPAYFFYMMEGLIAHAQTLGLSYDIASKLTLHTAFGSAYMALHSLESVQNLRQHVTSPGGTTEQGIQALKNGKLFGLLAAALDAATKQCKVLSEKID